MKKLILILLPILFISCTKTVYIDYDTNKTLSPSEFINCEKIAENNIISTEKGYRVYRDTYTDVLYFAWSSGNAYTITPIMKADGTCLTYTEWKENYK